MDPARYARICEIYEAARVLEPGDRDEHLTRACGNDTDLRREVDSLLALAADAAAPEHPFSDDRVKGSREVIERLVAEEDGSEGAPVLPEAGPGGVGDTEQPTRDRRHPALLRKTGAPASRDRGTHLPETIGAYRVTRRIATGGMGTVYAAEQDHPHRTVAIKMIDPRRSSPQLVSRFKREAEILGRLKHPGIAQIFDASTVDFGAGAQPYLVMEYVEGEPLNKYADTAKLDTRARLDLVARIADAVDYAHRQGVIHRDLKPDNVLVDIEGRAKVLDFGIARATDDSTMMSTQVTQDGQILGTLAYMAPEQLGGDVDNVTPATDVYALGVIAFELLAGQPAHDVAGLALGSAVRVLSEQDVPPLGTIDARLRGDVETIVATALEKESARRYASAAALATDIRRHLDDLPITARRPSRVYRLRKFTRRNRALVIGGTTAVVALLAGLIVSLSFGVREREQRVRSDRLSYRTSMLAAADALADDRPAATEAYLASAPEHLRGWEWRELSARAESPARLVSDVPHPLTCTTTDGPLYASAARDGRVRIWEIASGDLRQSFRAPGGVQALCLRSEGEEIVAAGIGAGGADQTAWVSVHSVRTGERIRSWELDEDAVWAAIRPDGRHVTVSRDDGRRLATYDVKTREKLIEGPPEEDPALGRMIYSQDGRSIALRSGTGPLHLCDAATLARVAKLEGHTDGGWGLDFSPDHSTLVSGAHDRTARIWDLPRNPPIERAVLRHPDMVSAVSISPDGSIVATSCADGVARLWDIRDGTPMGSIHVGDAFVFFTSEGELLGFDRTGLVCAWDLGERPQVVLQHASFVYGLAASPDGGTLLTTGWDGFVGEPGCVRWWDAATGAPIAAWGDDATYATAADIAPGGLLAAVAVVDRATTWDARVICIDLESGRRVGTIPMPHRKLLAIAFDATGERLAIKGQGTTWIVDVATGDVVLDRGAEITMQGAAGIAWSPDPRWLAMTGGPLAGDVEIFDSRDPAVVRTRLEHASVVQAIAFHPSGRSVASAHRDGTVLVRDVATGRELGRMTEHNDALCVAFSPDGTRLASGGRDHVVRIWETESYEEVGVLHGHEDYVYNLRWTPDGAQLVSASGDGTAHIWDTRSRAERRAAIADRERLVAELAPMVQTLFAELEDGSEVAARVKADQTLSARARQVALQLVLGESIRRANPE